MSLAYRTHGGLIVAETAADERTIADALRAIDRRLCLQVRETAQGVLAYSVVCMVSDTYAPIIFTWTDDYGNPLPLSSGLVEEFKKLRPEARERRGPDAEEHNRRLVEKVRADAELEADAVMDDHRAKVERGRVTVSLGAGTSKPYWQRNSHLPAWLREIRR